MALALHDSDHANGTDTTVSATITTTVDDTLIVVSVLSNATTISGVDSASLTFTRRATADLGGSAPVEIWTAPSSGQIDESVTVTVSSSAYTTIDVFAISGANISTPMDGNAGLPSEIDNASTHCSVSTDTADTFIIGSYRFNSQGSPTAGTGFTAVSGADFLLTEYNIVSTTQSSLDVDIGTGDGDSTAGVAHAVVIAAAGGATPYLSASLMGCGW